MTIRLSGMILQRKLVDMCVMWTSDNLLDILTWDRVEIVENELRLVNSTLGATWNISLIIW